MVTFTLQCVPSSNTITLPVVGDYDFGNIGTAYIKWFDQFTQTNPNCGFSSINFITSESTLVIYDAGGTVLSTATDIESSLGFETTDTHNKITFPQHCDAMRDYTFRLKFQTDIGDFETDFVKITSTSLALVPPTVEDASFSNMISTAN